MVKHKCGGCSKDVSGKSVACSVCELWFHTGCADIGDNLYKNILETSEECGFHVWCCKPCRSSIQVINKRVTVMESRLKKMESSVQTNTKDISTVNTRVDTIEGDVKKLREEQHNAGSNESVFRELNERENRKGNVVIHNVVESSSAHSDTRVKHDQAELTKILNIVDPDFKPEENIKFSYRAGERTKPSNDASTQDPRPLIFGLKNKEDVQKLLSNCRNLKGSSYDHVSVIPDLTKQQRKEEQDLRKKVDEMNAERTEEDAGNFIWKVVGPRGQRKMYKAKVTNTSINTNTSQGTRARGRPRRGTTSECTDKDTSKRNRTPESNPEDRDSPDPKRLNH